MTREYIHVSEAGDVVVVCARDRIQAQAMIEAELGHDVPQSQIKFL